MILFAEELFSFIYRTHGSQLFKRTTPIPVYSEYGAKAKIFPASLEEPTVVWNARNIQREFRHLSNFVGMTVTVTQIRRGMVNQYKLNARAEGEELNLTDSDVNKRIAKIVGHPNAAMEDVYGTEVSYSQNMFVLLFYSFSSFLVFFRLMLCYPKQKLDSEMVTRIRLVP